MEVVYYKLLPPDPDFGSGLCEELFRIVNSTFVPRVGDSVRWKEATWPVEKFTFYPARTNYEGKHFPERASVYLGKPDAYA